MTIMSLCMEIKNSFEFIILVPDLGSFSIYGTGFGTLFDPSLIYDDGPLGGVLWILFVLLDRWLIVFSGISMFSIII